MKTISAIALGLACVYFNPQDTNMRTYLTKALTFIALTAPACAAQPIDIHHQPVPAFRAWDCGAHIPICQEVWVVTAPEGSCDAR